MKLFTFYLVVASFLPLTAMASSAVGLVEHLVVHHDGADLHKFDVTLKNPTTDQPEACDSGSYSANLTTESGRAQYSMLLAAAMANQPVEIVGQASCFQGSTREALRNVHLRY